MISFFHDHYALQSVLSDMKDGDENYVERILKAQQGKEHKKKSTEHDHNT